MGKIAERCEFLRAYEVGEEDEEKILRNSFCGLSIDPEIALMRCFYPVAMCGWKECFLRLQKLEETAEKKVV